MEKLFGIVKDALGHSIAQTFLIFSGILVIFSLSRSPILIIISFSTLIYALIAHYLTAVRRHESLGRYAIGNNPQAILFTITFILFFVWWVAKIMGYFMYFRYPPAYGFLSHTWLLIISMVALIIAIIFFILWFICIFYNKHRTGKNLKINYRVRCFCKNCDFNGKTKIPLKRPLKDHPCPWCGSYALVKKNECWYCAEK
ncbi:MAG: hypothetical protein CEN90_15 [Parcubacteria group bacterium Licking1014_17]|nr:MAG: hypothetical protein CEN90_15 [Parcubacteria group bacterium Licking1014_17]